MVEAGMIVWISLDRRTVIISGVVGR